MKENESFIPVKENKELLKKVKKFLDFLYKYDCVGKDAFLKKQEELKFFTFDRSYYQMEIEKKYIWINAPYLKLGVSSDESVFNPKKKYPFIGKIDRFLGRNKLKRKVKRIHTSKLRYRGQLGSEIIHYYDLTLTN